MKYLISILLICFLLSSVSIARTVRVKSSINKSGKYVPFHYRTSPNKTKIDNWSTKENTNPYTGKKGSKKTY